MDNSKRYQKLFDGIEAKKIQQEEARRKKGEEAAKFPSKEEYLEKDMEERLGVAWGVLERYAHVPRHRDSLRKGKWARADVEPKDRKGAILRGYASHRDDYKEYYHHPEDRDSYFRVRFKIPEGIDVRVRAVDTDSDMTSDEMRLGEFRNGKYTNEEGESHEGWHVFIPERAGNYPEGTAVSLDHERAQEMMEFVDAAVVGLMDGVISEHRQFLGGQAVEGSAQPVAPTPTP